MVATALTILIPGTAIADGYGANKDIVDAAVDAGSFTTSVEPVQAAGLVDTLKALGSHQEAGNGIT